MPINRHIAKMERKHLGGAWERIFPALSLLGARELVNCHISRHTLILSKAHQYRLSYHTLIWTIVTIGRCYYSVLLVRYLNRTNRIKYKREKFTDPGSLYYNLKQKSLSLPRPKCEYASLLFCVDEQWISFWPNGQCCLRAWVLVVK